MTSERIRADDLVGTGAERDALAALREVTGVVDGPMERHGLRCHLLCVRMAADRGSEIDAELSLVAGFLHDIGLYEGASENGVYVRDGRHFAERLLEGRAEWPAERMRLLGDAIERHHELRPQWGAGTEVELLRRADLVELSRGVVAWGLDRGWIRGLWSAVPLDGIYGEIGRIVGRALVERPTTVPRIFIRGR